jgi:hypothetical protein
MNIFKKIAQWFAYTFNADWTITGATDSVYGGQTDFGDEVYVELIELQDMNHPERETRFEENGVLHIYDGDSGQYLESIIN